MRLRSIDVQDMFMTFLRCALFLFVFAMSVGSLTSCDDQPRECIPGEVGCPCSEGVYCAGSLACVEGTCQAPACSDGQLNCPCASGRTCENSLVCNSQDYCVSNAGYAGGPCFANRTCRAGNLCNTETLCEPCAAGTLGCECLANATCDAALECLAGTCSSEGMTSIPPANPVCYTPCNQDFTDAAGAFRDCSPEGLMEGCLSPRTCVDGSCNLVGDAPTTCSSDEQCPDFQACAAGQCYSTCDNDTECGGAKRCHRHVCRLPCSDSPSSECPNGQQCELADGQYGYCTAVVAPAGEPTRTTVGAFNLGRRSVSFSNTEASATVTLENASDAPTTFTLSKVSHREYTTQTATVIATNPMPWLTMGVSGNTTSGQTVTFTVAARATASIVLQNPPSSGGAPPARWEGVLRVSAPRIGEAEINLDYASRPDGRWTGNAYYFSQFGDAGLAAWMANKTNITAINQVQNAFVRKWAALRTGDISIDEFDAVLMSTSAGSWNFPSTRSDCIYASCFPYVYGSDGLAEYSNDLTSSPIPSGVVELPIAIDIQQSGVATAYTGRIVSSHALQYAGDHPLLCL